MKKVIMLILLVLIVVISLKANSNEDMQEYSRKWNIEQERAKRFKQETGFEGTITQHFRENGPMRFGSIGGNFSDIVVTAKEDTVIMKQIFEQVKAKIMPYVKAEEGQLFAEKVEAGRTFTGIIYNQKINGYPVYRSGRLVIDYNFSTSEFIITDNTREIPSEYVPINITEDEAIEIVLKHYGDEGKFDIYNKIFRMRFIGLQYESIPLGSGEKKYKLCYLMSHGGYLNFIDPSSGKVVYREEEVRTNETLTCNVTGDIYEAAYTDSSIQIIHNHPLPYILVATNQQFFCTDYLGNAIFSDSLPFYGNINISQQYYYPSFFDKTIEIIVTQYPDTLDVLIADSLEVNNNFLNAYFLDNLPVSSTNIYYHAMQQFEYLNNLSPVTNFNRIIQTNKRLNNAHGECIGERIINIDLLAGRHSHVTRHELSHAYVFNKLDNEFIYNLNNNKNFRGMDEAFAVYLTSTAINSELHISPSNSSNITNYHISTVKEEYYPLIPISQFNEDFYSRYYCRYPIASAWWELREHFGAEDFDDKLIRTLIRLSKDEDLSRNDWHKPRVFYNKLMNSSTEEERTIIDSVYSDRGLYFTPKVITVSDLNSDKNKNIFFKSEVLASASEPIYIKVTHLPQNTDFTVYIVDDKDYTDGMDINNNNFNIVYSTDGTSNNNGEWTSNALEDLPLGDYDVIVDVGGNNKINFEYLAANVTDGIDGFNGPGFTVYDDGIDVVVAVDAKNSYVRNDDIE